MLADRYGDRDDWAWIDALGGFMKIEANEAPTGLGLVEYKPGQWFKSGAKMRMPGFSGANHKTHGHIKVRVSEEAMKASYRTNCPSVAARRTGRPVGRPPILRAPPSPEAKARLGALQDAVRGLYEQVGDPVPAAAEAWLMHATAEDMADWLAKSGAEVPA